MSCFKQFSNASILYPFTILRNIMLSFQKTQFHLFFSKNDLVDRLVHDGAKRVNFIAKCF